MNRNLAGKWKQISGKPGEQWGGLTRDRLSMVPGQHNQAPGRTQDRHRIYQEEALRRLKAFLHRHREWDPSTGK